MLLLFKRYFPTLHNKRFRKGVIRDRRKVLYKIAIFKED